MTRLLTIFILALLSTSCSSSIDNKTDLSADNAALASKKEVLRNIVATVTYVNIEGGFYGLVAEDGQRYLPTNLPAHLQGVGNVIKFTAKLNHNPSFRMWGQQVDLMKTELIRTSLTVQETSASNTVQSVKINHVNATVKFIDISGGFYGLIAEDGSRYYPENLSSAYQIDGLNVRVSGRVSYDMASVRMWGEQLRITKISLN